MSMKRPKMPAATRPPNPAIAPASTTGTGRAPMFGAFRNAAPGMMAMFGQRAGRRSLIGG